MRVVLWQELFWPHIGGIEILSAKLICALRERGHELVVATRQDSPDLPSEAEYQGIPIYRYPFPGWAFTHGKLDALVETRRQVMRLIRDFQPHLVHLNSFGPSFLMYHMTLMENTVPLLATLHTTPKSILSKQSYDEDSLFKRTLCNASWVSSVSEAVLNQARELVPAIIPRSCVIYNGIKTPALRPSRLSFQSPRLLVLGRLIRDKGVDLAISAFAAIADRFPELRMVIGGDGPERSSLEVHAASMGVADRIEFLGWVSPEKVPPLLNSATIVVMPSHREGLPSVALEAALMARPVVATHVGGVPEVVTDRKTGLLVPPGNELALAIALRHLLDKPDTAARLGEAARARAQQIFGFTKYVDTYEALYYRLTAGEG